MTGKIDYHRKELIRHHKTLRSQFSNISGSKCPISFDDLESTRTTFFEMKNGAKKVEKDDWRAVSGPEKRFDKQWRGRTVFKIKAGVALPAEELASRQVFPVSPRESLIQVTRLSLNILHQKRNQENLSQAQHQLRKVSPDRVRVVWNEDLVVRQFPPAVEYDEFGKELVGELEKELDRELDKSDDVRRRRPKGDDVEYEPSSDDERWEKANKKPGSESLEPRRISVPLPGSEAQALTPANRKMIKRLDDKVELYKLHVKHLPHVTNSIFDVVLLCW